MINTAPLFLAAACLALVAGIWRGNKLRKQSKLPRWMGWLWGSNRNAAPGAKVVPKWARLSGLLAAGAGALLVVALIPWQNVLAGWAYPGWGPGILAIALLMLFATLYWEWWHRHGYHLVFTNLACFMFGTAAMVAYALQGRLLHRGSHLLPQTGAALQQTIHHMSSGKAAKAVHSLHATSSGLLAWGGIAVFLLVIFLAVGGHKLVRRAHAGLGSAGQQANAKKAAAAVPGGRKAPPMMIGPGGH